jgi:hypothetical protein
MHGGTEGLGGPWPCPLAAATATRHVLLPPSSCLAARDTAVLMVSCLPATGWFSLGDWVEEVEGRPSDADVCLGWLPIVREDSVSTAVRARAQAFTPMSTVNT